MTGGTDGACAEDVDGFTKGAAIGAGEGDGLGIDDGGGGVNLGLGISGAGVGGGATGFGTGNAPLAGGGGVAGFLVSSLTSSSILAIFGPSSAIWIVVRI